MGPFRGSYANGWQKAVPPHPHVTTGRPSTRRSSLSRDPSVRVSTSREVVDFPKLQTRKTTLYRNANVSDRHRVNAKPRYPAPFSTSPTNVDREFKRRGLLVRERGGARRGTPLTRKGRAQAIYHERKRNYISTTVVTLLMVAGRWSRGGNRPQHLHLIAHFASCSGTPRPIHSAPSSLFLLLASRTCVCVCIRCTQTTAAPALGSGRARIFKSPRTDK